MSAKDRLVVGLLGALVGLLLVVTIQFHAVPGAQGQSAPGGDSGWLMATGDLAGGGSVCWLFDTRNTKLGVYVTRGTNLQVTAIRACNFDFQFTQFGKAQQPSVTEMEKAAKQQR